MKVLGKPSVRDLIISVGPDVATVLLALIVGALIVKSALTAVAFGLALLLFGVLSRSPLNAISLLVFFIPFSQTDIMSESIASFPGARPFLLLGAFVGIVAFLNYKYSTKIPPLALALSILIISLLVEGVLRSLPKIDVIGAAIDQDYSPLGFILSYIVKPMVYLMPIFVITKFAKDEKDVNRLVNALVMSLIVLSAYFLYNYTFNVKDKSDPEGAWEYVTDALGLWKGSAGFLYVIGFPMVLARYFAKKDIISLVGMVLCVISVGFLYSRTAYVTVVAAFFLYMFLSKRSKFMPVLLVVGLGASFIISDTVLQRAQKGITDEDPNEVLSGRLDHQWLPLIEEYLATPFDMVVGRGRYAVVTTKVWQSGILPGAMHPHNMYLEMVLDAGFVGLIPMLTVVLVLLYRIYRILPLVKDRITKEYCCGCLVSIICYLMGGMTTGSLFPELENNYFWFIAGLSVVIIRLTPKDVEEETEVAVT